MLRFALSAVLFVVEAMMTVGFSKVRFCRKLRIRDLSSLLSQMEGCQGTEVY